MEVMDVLDKTLMNNWMQYVLKLKDPPDLDTFLSFLHYQRTVVPLSRHTAAAPDKSLRSKIPPSKKTALKLQETSRSSSKVGCVISQQLPKQESVQALQFLISYASPQ